MTGLFGRKFLGLCASWLFLFGCSDGLEPVTRITKERILGVVSSVEGDEARATPMPGEQVRLTMLVTQPGAATESDWRFFACTPSDRRFDVPTCDGPILAEFQSDGPRAGNPSFVLDVPTDANSDLLYFGALCLGGRLNPAIEDPFGGEDTLCESEGVARVVTGRVRVRGPENLNHAPVIETIRLRDQPWEPSSESPPATCEGLPVIRVAEAEDAQILVVPSEDSRERFLEASQDGTVERQEDLPVAFFATERGLTTFYSVIDDNREMAEAEFDTAEIKAVDLESLDEEGRVMRFEIVMRDDRGGVAHQTRFACLRP